MCSHCIVAPPLVDWNVVEVFSTNQLCALLCLLTVVRRSCLKKSR